MPADVPRLPTAGWRSCPSYGTRPAPRHGVANVVAVLRVWGESTRECSRTSDEERRSLAARITNQREDGPVLGRRGRSLRRPQIPLVNTGTQGRNLLRE